MALVAVPLACPISHVVVVKCRRSSCDTVASSNAHQMPIQIRENFLNAIEKFPFNDTEKLTSYLIYVSLDVIFDGKTPLPTVKTDLGDLSLHWHEPCAVLAAQHSDARVTSLRSPSSSASSASSSDFVGTRRNQPNRCCRTAAPSPSPAAPSTADVWRYRSLTCSITSAARPAARPCPSAAATTTPQTKPTNSTHHKRKHKRFGRLN